MATYDLVCEHCGHEFELYLKGFLDDEHKECPQCGSTEVRQKFTSFLRNLGGSCGAPTGSPFG